MMSKPTQISLPLQSPLQNSEQETRGRDWELSLYCKLSI
jgi:hypothetical protein